MFRSMIWFSAIALMSGCAHYEAPGRAADFRAMGITPEAQRSATSDPIQAAFDRRPLASFPANVAVVRVQASGYRSETASGWGSGNYSIVTARDVEPADTFDRLRKLPQVRGIATLNQLVTPQTLSTDRELRLAAANLQCDMVLAYTFDTAFHDRDLASPVSVITLGLAPTQATRVTTTASAVLIDTRNGYVYGLAEGTASRQGLATAWNTTSAIDGDRRKTEEEGFVKLLDNVETMWKGVVAEVGRK